MGCGGTAWERAEGLIPHRRRWNRADIRAQAAQLLRTVNAAKTINAMSMHASMYVPMSVPATDLPEYVRFDHDSRWETSALLSAAQETMSLPSRLRPDGQKQSSLGNLELALNVNGNQRIAQLQYNVRDKEILSTQSLKSRESNDERMRSDTTHALLDEDTLNISGTTFDMDLSGRNSKSSSRGQKSSNHVFGAVECLRGGLEGQQPEASIDHDELAYSRKRRRFAGMPVIEKWVIAFLTLNSNI